jgi:hypothetical protein
MGNPREKVAETVKEYVHKNASVIIGQQIILQRDWSHIEDLAISVVLTRDEKLMGGSFVQSIVNNDLERAIGSADSTALKSIKLLVLVKLWCHPEY